MGSAVWVRASSVVPLARPAGLFTSEREQESDGPDNDDENNAYYQRILHRIILITRPEFLHGAPSTGSLITAYWRVKLGRAYAGGRRVEIPRRSLALLRPLCFRLIPG